MIETQKAPLILFVFNRPDHTRRMLESLRQNEGIEEHEIIVFRDGPREQDIEKVNEVDNLLGSIDFSKTLEVIQSNENKGLANSIIEGVTNVLNKYGKCIVIEDDLILHRQFVQHIDEALNVYSNRKDIAGICGYTFPIKSVLKKTLNTDTFLLPRPASWGWGTWNDRWSEVDWEVTDFQNFKRQKKLQHRFNAKGGNDMTPMLIKQQMGLNNSWAIRWTYHHFKHNLNSVFFKNSLVNNIGNDGSGTHSPKTSKYMVEFHKTEKLVISENPVYKEEIVKDLSRIFNISLIRKLINWLTLR